MLLKNKRQTKKDLILTLFLIILFLVPLCFNLSNLNNDSSKKSEKNDTDFESIKLPKLSANEIVIKTPENKTYYNPMSGYYPATYGFENDIVGGNPKAWLINESGGTLNVIKELYSHYNVIEMHDTNAGGIKDIWMENDFSDQINGSIEFWFRTDNTLHNHLFTIYDGANVLTYVEVNDYQFGYWDTTLHSICPASSNSWYHVRIDFCLDSSGYKGLTADHYFVYINGTRYGEYPFLNNNNGVGADKLMFYTSTSDSNYYTYIDAIGYSWDLNYKIEDNKKDGLLLSFENSTNLDWIGYSLDNQANKTILGNATIPMPIEGLHKIQVSGNNSLGTMYQSEVKYFTISNIKIITPENKTYYNPLSGYYPATYGFEEGVGKVGEAISWVDWASPSSVGEIISELDGHRDVLRVAGSTTTQRVDHYSEQRTTGTIEFYHRQDASNRAFEMYYYDDNKGYQSSIRMRFYSNGYIQYDPIPAENWINICPYSANKWYHIKIEFDVADDWHLWIDGVSMDGGVGYTYLGSPSPPSHLDHFIYQSLGFGLGPNIYLDAYGESWGNNYNIGDNKKEGLLLSFENITNLDWSGYSLDVAANKTILGNATIPIPKGGHHTIQVFGNNSLGTNYRSEIRQFTVSPFNKVAFANTTYAQPTSGYYPATYGFENDIVGGNPKNWIIDEIAGTLNVIKKLSGHYNVIEMHDTNDLQSVLMDNNFSDQINGTIEFWFRTDNLNSNRNHQFVVSDGANYLVYFVAFGFEFKYWDTSYHTICPALPNNWYHIRIDFCLDSSGYKGLTADHYFVYINGIKYGEYPFIDNNNGVGADRLRLFTGSSDENYYTYFDAVGYSWDPNYNIGNNKKEGLYLGFENSTTLDWIGYSLNGAAIKTILGNATIPMPANGIYTIQLFCNDTSGNYYDSEVVHFTVAVAQTPTTPSTPVSSGGDDGGGGGGTKTEDSSIFLIILVGIVAALIGTFSYVLYRYHTKGPKPEKKKVPKPKKERKPKPPKQKKVKKPIKGVVPGIIYCPYCFNENPSTAEYCSYCGVNFKEAEEKKGELPNEKLIIKREQTKVEEEIDVKNIMNKDVILNILRLKGENPQDFEELLNKIFQTKEEKELIRIEISRVPEGTFKDFLIAYEKITKELESKKPEHDFNNENYFKEGGKSK